MTIPKRMPDSPNRPKPQVADLKVLVVEDQPFQRRLLAALLKSFGVGTIVEAQDGSEGLAALESDPAGFDIAFVDLKMEGMDGIEFIRHAADRQVDGFIVTTALEPDLFSYVNELGAGFGADILGTLKKPVTLDQIAEHLERYLAKGNAISSTARHDSSQPHALWTKADLQAALLRKEFVPFFQPKVDLNSRHLVGVEILSRWNHPTLGILSPFEFIGRMEDERLIDELTRHMIEDALKCVVGWGDAGLGLNVAINVSPLTLQRNDMAKRVLSLVRQFPMAPESITIEVTETAVSQDAAGLLETLTRLRMQGFNLSVDDFGTGYSSLQQLSELPFNEVKIDRSFVHGRRDNTKATIILESIIQLGRKLGLQIVAEGIKTEEELEYLKALGCSTGQGFYLAKPMSNADMLAYLGQNAH